MKILIACEESQTVCKAFRAKGHEAFSCDILPCSGGHPEWHLKEDVNKFLLTDYYWDMIIAFPPCTDLAVSGARHFKKKQANGSQYKSINFFMQFTNVKCSKIVIENPIGIMSTLYRKPDQIIQPYMFGEPHKKSTCLWLKGVQKLEPTNIVEVNDYKEYKCKNGKIVKFSNWYNQTTIKGNRQKSRSKTFSGIAKAMAEQWG